MPRKNCIHDLRDNRVFITDYARKYVAVPVSEPGDEIT